MLGARKIKLRELNKNRMKFNEKKLFQLISKLKKVELLEYIKSCYYEMDDKQQRSIFGELYNKSVNKNRTPEKLYLEIKSFCEKSNAGYYYAPFNINSKNFMYTPNETDEWFDELSEYLDASSNLVKEKKYKIANNCFENLYSLIEKMEEGEEIVFADEYGTWMISTELDYDEAYIKSLAKTKNEKEFTEKVIPLLIRDSYESFSSKIYKKIKKVSKIKQMREVDKEIELQEIKISK